MEQKEKELIIKVKDLIIELYADIIIENKLEVIDLPCCGTELKNSILNYSIIIEYNYRQGIVVRYKELNGNTNPLRLDIYLHQLHTEGQSESRLDISSKYLNLGTGSHLDEIRNSLTFNSEALMFYGQDVLLGDPDTYSIISASNRKTSQELEKRLAKPIYMNGIKIN